VLLSYRLPDALTCAVGLIPFCAQSGVCSSVRVQYVSMNVSMEVKSRIELLAYTPSSEIDR
jgi:hypothetical protein